MEFWKSLSGMLIVEFTSADPEHTFDAITLAKIPLSHIAQKAPLSYQVTIRRKDYRKLSSILKKRGNSLRIVSSRGLYWSVKRFIYRPILLISFFLLLLSSYYLPSRVFFLAVEGNKTVPDRRILSAAEECGIRFAASRKLVRSEKVKNALLSSVPQLQWAGVNTAGCTAVISVRERAEEDPAAEEKIVSNLIAKQDGFILSATITGGTAHFLPGEAVTKGQLLVSGYTDCGICIRAARAEGEILAQTNHKIAAVMPKAYIHAAASGEEHYRIGILLGKKRINLWKDSRIFNTGCGRMYEEYYVSLPGGFQLPIALCIDRYRDYELREATVSEDHALLQLQEFSEAYLKEQMVAGQIVKKQQRLTSSANVFQLDSRFVCTEMIGIEQREQIGVINGKRN